MSENPGNDASPYTVPVAVPGYTAGIIVENDPNEKLLKVAFAQLKEQRRANEMLYDYSHPVDEYEYNTTAVDITTLQGNVVVIQPAYSSNVRIETVTALLPVGIETATLQLGKRFLPLYNGPTTTGITVVNLHGMGIILNGSDDRFLSWTTAGPVVTSGYYIALAGHTNYRG